MVIAPGSATVSVPPTKDSTCSTKYVSSPSLAQDSTPAEICSHDRICFDLDMNIMNPWSLSIFGPET